jgi:signal transduction histidine kinase
MALILVVPVLAIVGLAVDRLVESGGRALNAELVTSLTGVSADIAGVTQEVQSERMKGARLVAGPDPAIPPTDTPGREKDLKAKSDAYTAQTKATDDAIARYNRDRHALRGAPAAIAQQLDGVDQKLATVNLLRQQIINKQGVSVGELVLRYGVVIDTMVAFHGQLSQVAGDTQLANSLRAVAAFAQAKAAASLEEAVGFASLQSGALDAEAQNSFITTLTTQESALAAFDLVASPTQKTVVHTIITGDAVQLADHVADQFSRSTQDQAIAPLVKPDELAGAVGAVVDLMRYTEQQLDAGLLTDARNLRSSVIKQVVVQSILVVITLIIAVLITAGLARGMVRALARLREGALGVASRDLPEAVARLRDVRDIGENSPEEIARQVRDPIQIDSRDEIGQVAQAFNVVHREAVRVAAEQASLRTSVSAMFLNLARRSQALVDRMIGELDSIERGEEDPKRLARLFQLDHLATRMRRNDENLLVLAGADSSAPRREDAPLADVVRAAQSEVELYNRIEFGTIDPDVSIAARAVNDVVRLLAELFDNSTRFSPPTASVLVDARRIGDYVLLQIEDHGLGMSEQQMASLNERLARPPSVDIAAFRMMGLAVVGRLADRYAIRVSLQTNPEGGTITHLTLPSAILILPRLRGREPVVSRPRPPLAVERGPAGSNGWPMPSLPGLMQHGGQPMAGGGLSTATLNGWADPADMRHEWTPTSQRPAGAPAIGATPSIDALGLTSPTIQRRVTADETAELPIFREAEAVWFRSHGGRPATAGWTPAGGADDGAGPAGYEPAGYEPYVTSPGPAAGPPPTSAPYVPPAAVPPPLPPMSSSSGTMPPPRQRPPVEESWQTAADDGWRRAAAASAPSDGGTTRSGLPKRVPAAQLVPGGIDNQAAGTKARRTPDEVRGLLSAYHRGVQRGRTGDGSGPAQRSTDEERH